MAIVSNKGNAYEPVDQHWHGNADEVHGGGDGTFPFNNTGEWNDSSSVLRDPYKYYSPVFFGSPATGQVSRFNRVFVGQAAHSNSERPSSTTSWTWINGGSWGDISSLVSVDALGGLAVTGATRSSDYRAWAGTATAGSQAINGFALNDDLGAGSPIVCSLFGSSVHNDGCTGVTLGMQIELYNAETTPVDVTPYSLMVGGATMPILLTSGGEIAGYSGNVSCAICVAEGNVAKFRKGILFWDNALDTTIGAGGRGVAIEMARGQSIRWQNSGGATDAEICGVSSGLALVGPVVVPSGTASTSTTTGALTVSGGVGVGGAVNASSLNAINGGSASDLSVFNVLQPSLSGSNETYMITGKTRAVNQAGIFAFHLDTGTPANSYSYLSVYGGGELRVSGNGRMSVSSIASVPNYADDVAAAAGGIGVGGIYRTASALKIRVA